MKRRRRLLTALAVVVFLVAACEGEDAAFVEDFMKDWLLSHAGQIVLAKLGGGSGDNMVDAAVEGQDVMSNQDEADKKFATAYQNGNTAVMDALIKEHPNDWGYKVDRGATALERGDLADYTSLTATAESQASGRLTVFEQELNDLRAAEAVLSGGGGLNGFKDKLHCQTVYSNLLRVAGVIDQNGGKTAVTDRDAWGRAFTNC
jgi:hypothetical protein